MAVPHRMRYRRGQKYKGQETFKTDSVGYEKVLEKITCKRANHVAHLHHPASVPTKLLFFTPYCFSYKA